MKITIKNKNKQITFIKELNYFYILIKKIIQNYIYTTQGLLKIILK